MICPFCKEEILDGALRCERCQAILQLSPDGQSETSSDIDKNYNKEKSFFDAANLYYTFISYQGRLNRKRYWASFGLLFTSALVCHIISDKLAVLFGLLTWYSHIVIGIKRLHDQDKSGHWMWLTLVPLFNLYVAVLLMCISGTKGPNRFGEDLLQ